MKLALLLGLLVAAGCSSEPILPGAAEAGGDEILQADINAARGEHDRNIGAPENAMKGDEIAEDLGGLFFVLRTAMHKRPEPAEDK